MTDPTDAPQRHREAPIPSNWYDESYYEKMNRGQDGEHEVFDFAVSLAEPVASGMTALDVGCGRGELVMALAARGASVLGVDYSDAALGLARQRVADLGSSTASRIRLEAMDAKRLDVPDDSVDRVFMLDVVEHLHPWELSAAAGEIHRILKPGGILVVHTCPNRRLFVGVRRLASAFRLQMGSDRFHVNEQDDTTLCQVFNALDPRAFVLRDPVFWSNAIPAEHGALHVAGVATDKALALPGIRQLVDNTSMVRALGTNVWMVGVKRTQRVDLAS